MYNFPEQILDCFLFLGAIQMHLHKTRMQICVLVFLSSPSGMLLLDGGILAQPTLNGPGAIPS